MEEEEEVRPRVISAGHDDVGFVFATMKTRIGHLLTLHGSVRPIN